jgi:hypothetical protein
MIMAVHASTIGILVDKGKFTPEVALAIGEALDNTMQASELVTVSTLDNRIADLRREIDVRFANFEREIDAKFAEARRYVDARFAEMQRDMDARFTRVDAQFQKVDARFDEQLHIMNMRIAECKISMIRWFVGISIAQTAMLAAVIVGAMYLLLQYVR